jgi:UDP-2,3-diacylglucosamine pyrophosphatase LpxH
MGSHPLNSSNLLVCSDLHLGGTLRGEDIAAADGGRLPFAALRRAVRQDRAVSKFLDYHQENLSTNTQGASVPWRLILNGDIFDFLHLDVRPTGESENAPSEEETLYGLSFEENRSCWKLGVICSVHRRTIQALASFVDAGHEIVFIIGNHDVDLWFDKVRNGLLDAIALMSEAPDTARSRIQFEPWFYFEADRAYIEHGHRFDPYNTFPDPLQPLLIRRERELAPTFGHFSLRYFCNRVRSFPIYDMDHNPISKIIRWIIERPKKEVFMAAVQWTVFMWRYIRTTFLIRRDSGERQAQLRQKRRNRLRRFAKRYGMPIKRILALDALKRAHVGASLLRFAQGMLLDRVALVCSFMAMSLAVLSLSDGWVTGLLLTAIVSAVVWGWLRLDKTRPIHDVQPLLGRLARRIGKLTGARVVVFGHTHKSAIERRGSTEWMNPGSWEHLPFTQSHDEDCECTCSVKYGVVTGQGQQTQAYLVDWCSQSHVPIGACQSEGETTRLPRLKLAKGVGSMTARLNQILGSLRDGPRHVTTLSNQPQVADPKVR